ncbi:MAG: type II toxin-antitoxin system HicA family toxin [Rhodocyclales bacterium]|nr:type II toxin-antitoxin system HicA family toxin [Rhodocyclales bacterium]
MSEVRQRGSHKQFRDVKGKCTTVPFHQGRDISPILLRQIAKDIGLTLDEFLHLARKAATPTAGALLPSRHTSR